MKGILINIAVFGVGAIIGGIISNKIAEEKYKKIADEEIASVKEMYHKKKVKDDIVEKEQEKTIAEYEKQTTPYKTSDDIVEIKIKTDVERNEVMINKPRVISPTEFEDNENDYDIQTLTYYNDDVLTDDVDNPYEDVEDIVGLEFKDRFGEYEKDTVYVQNDDLECLYEIQADERNYYDIYPDEK